MGSIIRSPEWSMFKRYYKEAKAIMIDGVEYVIDKDGAVYDIIQGKAFGFYNSKKKEWITQYETPRAVKFDITNGVGITQYQDETEEDSEEDSEEVGEINVITIDDVEYLIDDDGAVYDVNSEEAVGVYDREKKQWIMRV